MARPRKDKMHAFHDEFDEMSLEDQAAALRILTETHRLAVRRAEKLKADEKPKGDS